MISPFNISEIKPIDSPLVELSKKFDILPDRELNKSLGEKSSGMIPRNGGKWSGEPGNSTWKPDREITPSNRNYSNPEGKTWGEILDKYGIEGIHFNNEEPDFSEISKATVKMMQDMEQEEILIKQMKKLLNKEVAQKKKFVNGVKRIIILGTNEATAKQWTKYLVKYMEILLIVVEFQKREINKYGR